jgi:hypothetical protein
MRKRDLIASAFKRIAALTDREYWEGVYFLEIPKDTAEAVRKRALRYYAKRYRQATASARWTAPGIDTKCGKVARYFEPRPTPEATGRDE